MKSSLIAASAKLGVVVYVFASVLAVPAQAQTPEMVDRLTQQWLDTEAQTVRMSADWRSQKPLLEQRLALLAAEKRQLQGLLQTSSDSQQGVEARRAELLAEQAELEKQQQSLTRNLEQLMSRMTSLAPLLPPPLAQQWFSEQADLAEQPEASQKLQTAVAQLSRLAEFDARLTVQEGVLVLPDVGELVVKQLYLGVGMAWFVSADGQHRGWGHAADEGWVWQQDEALDGAEISRAIAIFERREQADFVRLPIRLPMSLAAPRAGAVSVQNPLIDSVASVEVAQP